MLDNVFLTPQKQRELKVFRATNISGDLNLAALAEQDGMSYVEFYRTFRSLPNELTADAPPDQRYSLSASAYRQQLIKQSVPYRIIYATYKENITELDQVLIELSISQSTLQRRLKNLKTFLAQRDIRLDLSRVRLHGDERQIRLFYWYLFSDVAEDVGNLVPQICQWLPTVSKYFNLPTNAQTPRQAMQLNYIQVTLGRILSGFMVEKLGYIQVLEVTETTALKKFAQEMEVPEVGLARELTWLNEVLRHSPYFWSPAEITDLPSIEGLSERLIAVLQLTSSTHYFAGLVNYLNSCINYVTTSDLPVVIWSLMTPPASKQTSQIKQAIRLSLPLLPERQVQLLTTNLALILAPFIEVQELTICLWLAVDPSIHNRIINSLKAFSPFALKIIDGLTYPADLIITSQALPNDVMTEVPNYQWENGKTITKNLRDLLELFYGIVEVKGG
ncbi:helix-turn-helix domain-containing protein [Loigolactobacillus zhaoyuanensis]|uniref:helix-turn-helix domain-containing protein n=1 Tax=Loigolactobacillus zhaoyuanensis TaxID=2486017 RepID=UPI000F73F550|nr:helix-turn-helix domain-containing protein [Loigolactobacillus zhaoyuanensis]